MKINLSLWAKIRDAMVAGHHQPRAVMGDQFLDHEGKTLLSRAAWVPGIGIGVKSVSVFPTTPALHNLPTIDGSMVIFDDKTGQVRGTLSSDRITNLKTATDSVLGASLLARKDARNLLIVGAGKVAMHLVQAYAALMPHLNQVQLWNRTAQRGAAVVKELQALGFGVEQVEDLRAAAQQAHVISCAVMTSHPVLRGAWVQPGTHVDLIGAFNKSMREGDDELILKSRLFCDCLDTTVDHIGEFYDPIQRGLIKPSHIRGDFYDLIPGRIGRQSDSEITLCKNGGGAHLDLMTAQVLLPPPQQE